MKILHIVPSYKPAYIYGGPIESVSRLCEGIANAGHLVDVYTTTANGPVELDVVPGATLNIDGVQVTYFRRISKDPTHISPGLWRSVSNNVNQYDIVHIHSWWNVLVMIAALISTIKGVKVIVAPRGMLSQYIFKSSKSRTKKILHNLLGRRVLARTHFHATADSEADECKSLIPTWNGFVLPNLISLPELLMEHQNNDVFTMMFMSRIHPKKGLELLFQAISILTFEIVLKIAGTGEEQYIEELKALAAQLHISDKIVWLGWKNREEKFSELRNADMFTLVSFNENFANVVVEALHMGTAVLISKDVALSEFVSKNNLGWICTLQAEDIAEKITSARTDVQKLQYIRENGRLMIANNFSESKLIAQYIDCYQKIITEVD